ncbi:MAG: fibro-slime domain-containing protein [Deltaproteobacteria bacterium]|nr:fibro-slime domain-containing protein [Deltaproteobacteria bacterium]
MKRLKPTSIYCVFFLTITTLCGCEEPSKVNHAGSEDTPIDTSIGSDSSSDTASDSMTDQNSSIADTDTDTVLEPLQIISELPQGFTNANPADTDSSYGGYEVIGALDKNMVHDENSVCANIIRVIVRDFTKEHNDFQDAWNNSSVEMTLGADQKPVASDSNNTLLETEWYHNIDGVNMPFAVDLWLEPVGDTFVFDSANFFPIDNFGFPDIYSCCDNNGCPHNFHFTTEMHTKFKYNGGEEFTFIGDDDVFVFINNQLVIDLGGVHEPKTETVILDDVAEKLSLQQGEVYSIDLFQAERQWCGSTFRIETTLDFSGCGIILPTDITID